MNHSNDMAHVKEIIDLVRLLRRNGDELLSASSKLCLSTTLLHNLNEAFCLIVNESEDLDSSFQVCNSSKIGIFGDLKFLHDFVQKTVGLKVVKCSTDPEVNIDISKFRHLKYLELKKVCITSVKGIQGISGQLESIICTGKRGISAINQLLASCGGDDGAGSIWDSLRHLALPHNALEQLDASLELAPWLQTLDLSHNFITNAANLECLPNLKYVNLGYNKLEVVPTFHKASMHTIQVLVLKNNYIENINGLEGCECLAELDLSYNCLMEHSALHPLAKITSLVWLSLGGNPLAYHPKHRQLVIKHLHPCLVDNKFILDYLPLSRSEKVLVEENWLYMIKLMQTTSNENLTASSEHVNPTISGSVSTIAGNKEEDNEILGLSDSMEKSLARSKRKVNVKEAFIADDEDEKMEFESSSIHSASYLESSTSHLETKKQILALRQKFGENCWLTNRAGTFVHDIMGFQSVPVPSLMSAMNTNNSTDVLSSLDIDNQLTHPVTTVNSPSEAMSEQVPMDKATNADREEEKSTTNDSENNENASTVNETEDVINTLPSICEHEGEFPLDEGDLYLVQKKKTDDEMEELFLVVTLNDIKERDALTGKIKYSWSLDSVLSCVLGRGELVTVDIIFDTSRKDRQNRRYFVECDEAKKIVSTIGEKISSRPIMLKVFKCMKCSTHFSQDIEHATITLKSGVKQLKCPTCESTLVIQTDDLMATETDEKKVEKSVGLQPSVDQILEASTKPTLRHSDSYSSIGGTEGGAMSVTTSLVHFDSHPQAQACCSATSLEESRESTPSASALTKKYESDIEILSNPSQSSIEVLDEATRTSLTPNRKRSSEERRTALAPSLLTIPDATPIMAGLTESSSSGSLTDSICTAYEHKVVKQPSIHEKSSYGAGDKETTFTPVTNLTSMLGGLLSSIKIGSNKSDSKPDDDTNFSSNNVQYSYTDFRSVDHRVKLHIVLNIFEHENEELVLLVRADILTQSSREVFPGCLVLSTSKMYLLRIDGPEGEDPQRWLHKEMGWTMDRLRSFAPLPFKQGVLIELQQSNKAGEGHYNIMLLCILQDFQRTSNFLFYLTELPLPGNCEVEFSVPEHCSTLMHNLLTTTSNERDKDSVRLLALFSSATLKCKDFNERLSFSGLIITASLLLILKDNVRWLLPYSAELPVILREQSMSNLIEIEHFEKSLTINFLDEVAGLEESWTLDFSSTGATQAVISSVQPPWEELFSIPLQITSRVVHDTDKL